MTSPNPFRVRHSDQTQQEHFTHTFAPQIFSVLPPPPWTELLVLRSAPGAGKTSLMRALTADHMQHLLTHRTRFPALVTAYETLGAIDANGATVCGIRVNLDTDFVGLADLHGDEKLRTGLLFRLLDARIMSALLRAAARLGSDGEHVDVGSVRVLPDPDHPAATEAIRRLGGSTGESIATYASDSERQSLDLLDRLILRNDEQPHGHQRLYSLDALSGATILVNDERLPATPLIMLDDGHALAPEQRQALLDQLRSRSSTVGRWFAARSRALDDEDLIGAGDTDRDYLTIELEALERERTAVGSQLPRITGQRMTTHRYRQMLLEIADKRADKTMARLTDDARVFTSLLDVDPDDALGPREADILDAARMAVAKKATDHKRYDEWLGNIHTLGGRDGLARLAELEVLIERDQRRSQGDLFEDALPLPPSQMIQRGSSSLREAALLRASQTHNVPFYFGADTFARVASANVEQFLSICGDLTAQLQLQAASNRPIELTAKVQDRVLREASERYFNELARLPDGPLVQRLVLEIGSIAAEEAKKPTIPYPPGVTGTALSMEDRRRLRDAKTRHTTPGAEALWRALLSAIAHNVVWLELDYHVKNDRWMVIYLNRLLCPRFNMPLTLGGFRERGLRQMSAWFGDIRFEQQVLT